MRPDLVARMVTALLLLMIAFGAPQPLGAGVPEARSPVYQAAVGHDAEPGHAGHMVVADGDEMPAGHAHAHDPFDHTHDVPTASAAAHGFIVPPPMVAAGRETPALSLGPRTRFERPPRNSGLS